jgi:hypothetical protein
MATRWEPPSIISISQGNTMVTSPGGVSPSGKGPMHGGPGTALLLSQLPELQRRVATAEAHHQTFKTSHDRFMQETDVSLQETSMTLRNLESKNSRELDTIRQQLAKIENHLIDHRKTAGDNANLNLRLQEIDTIKIPNVSQQVVALDNTLQSFITSINGNLDLLNQEVESIMQNWK